jgi:hypothetical protein
VVAPSSFELSAQVIPFECGFPMKRPLRFRFAAGPDPLTIVASVRLAAGAPITDLAGPPGHASPTTTLRYYAREVPQRRPGRRAGR